MTTYGYHVIQVLGHEIRPLTPSAYQQQRQNKYDEWLKAAMASTSIQKYSWVNYVPKEPVIP
jgi:parvulin-like peptidyl-prolyl isomerase